MENKWEEFDVYDLGRLMVTSHDLENAVDELNFLAGEDVRERLYDVRYHAHKLAKLLSGLAIQAEAEYKAAVEAEQRDSDAVARSE